MAPPADTILAYDGFAAQEDSLGFQNPVDDEAFLTEERISSLERAFMSFSQVSNERISRIEQGLEQLASLMRSQQSQELPLGPVSIAHDLGASECNKSIGSPCQSLLGSPISSPCTAKAAQSRLLLVNVEKKWYTKRPFPDFEVRFVSGDSERLVHTTPNPQLRLRLLSGTGVYVDHFLNTPSLTFPLINGKSTISGIRFSAVSSRNGGFFQFEFSLSSPTDNDVMPVRSHEIRVLSERLKNEPKADNISELHGGDSLVRVPGIGKKYAARFRELGLMSISDLAAVNDGGDMGKRRRELLEAVRKDRGALTEAKLNDLIKDAQSVIDRDLENSRHHDTPDNGEDADEEFHTSDSEPESAKPANRKHSLHMDSASEPSSKRAKTDRSQNQAASIIPAPAIQTASSSNEDELEGLSDFNVDSMLNLPTTVPMFVTSSSDEWM